VLAPRIVDAQARAAGHEKLVDPPADQGARQRRRRGGRGRHIAATAPFGGVRFLRAEPLPHALIVLAPGRRIQIDGEHRAPVDEHDPAAHLISHGIEVGRKIGSCRALRYVQLKRLRRDGAVCARSPGEHFADQMILYRRNDVR
jgi:hypothetical protein